MVNQTSRGIYVFVLPYKLTFISPDLLSVHALQYVTVRLPTCPFYHLVLLTAYLALSFLLLHALSLYVLYFCVV